MAKPGRRRKESSSSEGLTPEFFKVFLPNQSSKRLRIPSAFVKYFNGALPLNCMLMSLAKISWSVDLKKDDNKLFFDKGWKDFVDQNSLEFGDFLIFSYLDTAQFNVKVYGKNGCLKCDTMEDTKFQESRRHKQKDSHGKERQINEDRGEENASADENGGSAAKSQEKILIKVEADCVDGETGRHYSSAGEYRKGTA